MFNVHRTFDLTTGVKNNSIAVFNNGAGQVAVIYHSTAVVVKRGRTVRLSNGGWDTVSTKIVINRALEQIAASVCYLYRKKGVLMITQNGVEKPFVSGMTIKVRDFK